MAKRFWIDSYIANKLGERLIPLLERLFAEGYSGVIDETAVDIGPFQGKYEWLDDHLGDNLIIEFAYYNIDLMTEKPFVWFSQNNTITEAAESFDDAIKRFDNEEEISDVELAINGFARNEGEWEHSPNYRGPVILLDSEKEILNMSKNYPSLTEVFIAAKAVGRMDMFEKFHKEYVDSEALLHNCDYELSMTGVEKVFIPSFCF